MVYFTSILSVFFFPFWLQSQQKEQAFTSSYQNDSLYYRHAKNFINEVYGERLRLTKLVLINEPRFGCDIKYIDSGIFNAEELAHIREDIRRPKIDYWNKFLDQKVNYIGQDSISRIFKNNYLRLYNGWEYFRKNIGFEINTIYAPIFLRNYEYCLFYTEYVCDYKCGEGKLTLYRRQNGKWVFVKQLCEWIS